MFPAFSGGPSTPADRVPFPRADRCGLKEPAPIQNGNEDALFTTIDAPFLVPRNPPIVDGPLMTLDDLRDVPPPLPCLATAGSTALKEAP